LEKGEKPSRIKQVNKEVEKMGVKILSQYALLGAYDFVNILEAPDTQTIARVALELGSRGALNMTTLAALSVDEFINALKKKKWMKNHANVSSSDFGTPSI
jgi:uncharacterized protein with GYD domain